MKKIETKKPTSWNYYVIQGGGRGRGVQTVSTAEQQINKYVHKLKNRSVASDESTFTYCPFIPLI